MHTEIYFVYFFRLHIFALQITFKIMLFHVVTITSYMQLLAVIIDNTYKISSKNFTMRLSRLERRES